MKKILSIIMTAIVMMAMVSCFGTTKTNPDDSNNGTENCNGNGSGDENGNGGGNGNGGDNSQATKLSNSKYYKFRDYAGETTETTVTFGKGNEVEYHVVWNWQEGGSSYAASGDITYRGTYTFTDTGNGNNLKGEGKLTMTDINDSSKQYTTQYYAEGDNLKIIEAAPNGDTINLGKVNE